MLIRGQSLQQDDPNVDLGPTTLGDGIIDLRDVALWADNWLGEVLPVGLKATWKLDETAGEVAYDSAGAFDATVMGDMLWQPDGGQVGGALELDGMDDYISTPSLLDPAEGAFSVFAWIKGGAPGQVIFSQEGSADWLSTDLSEGRLLTNVSPPVGRVPTPPLVSEVTVTDGNWHRVGLVWDGSARILYVDGLEAARDLKLLGRLTKSLKGLLIGAGRGFDPGSFWSGLIDDVCLYDRVVVP